MRSCPSVEKTSITYNPNKPYETQLPENFTIQVNDYPRLSGCMTLSNGQLVGIDQQGNYMSSISQSDCKKYMKGYRPFDYSAQSQNQQRERIVPQRSQLNPETSSL